MTVRLLGESWEITHARRGRMVIKLTGDTYEDEEYFKAILIWGEQESIDIDHPKLGDTFTFRQDLIQWHKLSEATP